jgi:mannose-6-phosphate isomerase-like protein (cupin superfamily)
MNLNITNNYTGKMTRIILKFALALILLLSFYNIIQAQTGKDILQPKLITLNLDSSDYQQIFAGPPSTAGIHSGLVTLTEDKTVGHHNTDDYEEIIVVFSGEGKMTFGDGKSFNLKFGVIAYCPPHTEHDIKNTGTTPLKYLYIATNTKH